MADVARRADRAVAARRTGSGAALDTAASLACAGERDDDATRDFPRAHRMV